MQLDFLGFRKFAIVAITASAAISLVAGQEASAQAKDRNLAVTSPEDICLTNACSRSPDSMRDEAAVNAAKLSKNLADLVLAGGTAKEVAAILRANCGRDLLISCDRLPKEGTEAFGRFTNGKIGLAGIMERRPDGSTSNGGFILTSIPGAEDLEAPSSVWGSDAPNMGRPLNARPNMESFTTTDGTSARRIVSYTLPSGEVVPSQEFSQRFLNSGQAGSDAPSR